MSVGVTSRWCDVSKVSQRNVGEHDVASVRRVENVASYVCVCDVTSRAALCWGGVTSHRVVGYTMCVREFVCACVCVCVCVMRRRAASCGIVVRLDVEVRRETR